MSQPEDIVAETRIWAGMKGFSASAVLAAGHRVNLTIARRNVHDQEEWIRDHGATLAGYIERYGSVADPKDGTLGGVAIYEADTLYLHLLVGQLRIAMKLAAEAGAS